MGKKTIPSTRQSPVVSAVLDNFFARLDADSSVDADVVARLRKALVEDHESTTDALKAALFSKGTMP